MQPRRPYPGIGHAVLMTLGVLMLTVVFSVPIVLLAAFVSGDPFAPSTAVMQSPWMIVVVNTAAFGGVVLWGFAANKVPWRVLLPVTRVPWSALGAVVVASVGLSVALSELNNLLQTVWPVSDAWQETFSQILDFEKSPWGVAIALVVVAPLTEEALFRGVILRGLLARNRPATAIIVSAALFGFVHLNPWQFLEAFGLGLAYGWWYRRTRSLIPAILGHALNNGLVFVLGLTGFDLPGYSSAGYSVAVVHQPWWLTLAGVALTGLGLWWFVHRTRGGPPEPVVEFRPIHAVPPPLPIDGIQHAFAPMPVEPRVERPAIASPEDPPR